MGARVFVAQRSAPKQQHVKCQIPALLRDWSRSGTYLAGSDQTRDPYKYPLIFVYSSLDSEDLPRPICPLHSGIQNPLILFFLLILFCHLGRSNYYFGKTFATDLDLSVPPSSYFLLFSKLLLLYLLECCWQWNWSPVQSGVCNPVLVVSVFVILVCWIIICHLFHLHVYHFCLIIWDSREFLIVPE